MCFNLFLSHFCCCILDHFLVPGYKPNCELLCNWLKHLAILSTNQKQNQIQNQNLIIRVFPYLPPSSNFASSSNFIGLPAFVVIGQSYYFGFGFTPLR